jgi:hypothetical protein
VRWLICGGRNENAGHCFERLDELVDSGVDLPALVLHGGAIGADQAADRWAKRKGIHTASINALWTAYPHVAGPLRNSVMLTLSPELVVALPGGGGTRDMVKKSYAAGLPVWRHNGKVWSLHNSDPEEEVVAESIVDFLLGD